MPRKKKPDFIVASSDFETDPFKYGRVPKPFAAGLRFDTPDMVGFYIDFWGDDCVAQLLDYLKDCKTPLRIYFHNGGKFDFHFLLRHLENPIKIINGRIVKARFGIHEFRDSWAIIPMALKRANQKDEVDYETFERECRDEHRQSILSYLRGDCEYLYELVAAFNDRFGPRLTIGGTAARELRKLHPQTNGREQHDAKFRPYYYGGRVECFESGVIRGKFKVYDVNSMYPYVMRDCVHPKGTHYVQPHLLALDSDLWFRRFPGRFYFCTVTGENRGALPIRAERGSAGLSFNERFGTFRTTSHELRTAIRLGLFKVHRIEEAHVCTDSQQFGDFVDTWSREKIAAKLAKEKIRETFAKLILNSAYGRFGINPYDFFEYYIQPQGEDLPPERKSGAQFEPYESSPEFTIWRARVNETPTEDDPGNARGFEDVAIAASITSAARAVLLDAIASANRPVYCDTDSLICEGLTGVRFSDTELGAWKLEGEGDRLAVAGKKLYCLMNGDSEIKSASKGVKLDSREIFRVARGETVLWQSDAPNFKLGGNTRFISRRARLTVQ